MFGVYNMLLGTRDDEPSIYSVDRYILNGHLLIHRVPWCGKSKEEDDDQFQATTLRQEQFSIINEMTWSRVRLPGLWGANGMRQPRINKLHPLCLGGGRRAHVAKWCSGVESWYVKLVACERVSVLRGCECVCVRVSRNDRVSRLRFCQPHPEDSGRKDCVVDRLACADRKCNSAKLFDLLYVRK